MKNKLLVNVFALTVAAFAIISCENKSNVTDVCEGMVKESMHKSVRSLAQQDGQKLTISEYEFLGGVNDNRMVYRTIAFGNGIDEPKRVDSLTYEYGEWGEANTSYALYITPRSGEPYTLWYKGNSFITPDGRSIGGEGTDNTARVEKWERTIASFSNTDWEATFRGELVMDSIFEDSIRSTFIPPMTIRYDTIKVFKGKMDTLSADTTCYFHIELQRNPATLANTGHFYKKSVRTKYNRESKTETVEREDVKEYDCNWFFSEVTSDAKFVITLQSLTPGIEGDVLSISKYKVDDAGEAVELLLGGLTYTRP